MAGLQFIFLPRCSRWCADSHTLDGINISESRVNYPSPEPKHMINVLPLITLYSKFIHACPCKYHWDIYANKWACWATTPALLMPGAWFANKVPWWLVAVFRSELGLEVLVWRASCRTSFVRREAGVPPQAVRCPSPELCAVFMSWYLPLDLKGAVLLLGALLDCACRKGTVDRWLLFVCGLLLFAFH